ncbi:hypothetical protein R6Q59_024217 [Mikania micrantha]
MQMNQASGSYQARFLWRMRLYFCELPAVPIHREGNEPHPQVISKCRTGGSISKPAVIFDGYCERGFGLTHGSPNTCRPQASRLARCTSHGAGLGSYGRVDPNLKAR